MSNDVHLLRLALVHALALGSLLSLAVGCGPSSGTPDAAVDVDGAPPTPDATPGEDGSPLPDALPVQCGVLPTTIRDFAMAHADFETYTGTSAYTGLIETILGTDKKPVYAHPGGTPQTTGPSEFDQWYRDVPGVNESFPLELHSLTWKVDQGAILRFLLRCLLTY